VSTSFTFDQLPAIEQDHALAEMMNRRSLKKHLALDYDLLNKGILDWHSFVNGYKPAGVNVLAVRRDPCTHSHEHLNTPELIARGCQNPNGAVREIRRQHNLRTTQGRDNWQRLAMFGDITANATSYTGASGAATSTSATSLTNTGAAFPTSGGGGVGGLQGHIVVSMAAGVVGVYAPILSNTATVLTIDQWYQWSSGTGAAGTTPTSTAEYAILPWAGMCLWMGLSTDATTPSASDVCRTADGLFGTGTSGSTASEQTANGLARTFVQPTFPSASNTQLQNTFTYTGSSSVTIAKVVLCNSKAAAGTLLFLDTLLASTATVAANGDTLQITWTVTL